MMVTSSHSNAIESWASWLPPLLVTVPRPLTRTVTATAGSPYAPPCSMSHLDLDREARGRVQSVISALECLMPSLSLVITTVKLSSVDAAELDLTYSVAAPSSPRCT
ncbi:hypothetical protein E2562_037836 [Oryza meyeriana var. granulata]|uniref:Uncharacterized protein n=1 Tax=Oryza meyeriana var. granulata TaxID=110450 RepID=A0A6G1EF16_9ORYZ|nr:hypothetical protein E2562_037836 [Oryza meyeriana var. granulata]